MISNHLLYNDLVHHPVETTGCLEFQVPAWDLFFDLGALEEWHLKDVTSSAVSKRSFFVNFLIREFLGSFGFSETITLRGRFLFDVE